MFAGHRLYINTSRNWLHSTFSIPHPSFFLFVMEFLWLTFLFSLDMLMISFLLFESALGLNRPIWRPKRVIFSRKKLMKSKYAFLWRNFFKSLTWKMDSRRNVTRSTRIEKWFNQWNAVPIKYYIRWNCDSRILHPNLCPWIFEHLPNRFHWRFTFENCWIMGS